MYVESLIGPDTVDTVPPATLAAFQDHGRVRATLGVDSDEAERVLSSIEALGISLDAVTERLLEEGVAKFAASFDQLMGTLEKRRRELRDAPRERHAR
jgi:transaldolase